MDDALTSLINDVQQSKGLTYRDMETRAEAAGHFISRQQLQNHATGGVRNAPRTEQVLALAAALGVPFEQVRDAVFRQFYGYSTDPHGIGTRTSTHHEILRNEATPPNGVAAEVAALHPSTAMTDDTMPDLRGRLVRFRVRGAAGVEVVIEGPVATLPELEASVERLLNRMEGNGTAS
jgi:hypothetical protein